MTTLLAFLVVAVFMLGLVAYAYAALLVWQERTALGRMTRVLSSWLGKIVLAAAAGVVMLVVVLLAVARWAFAGGGRPSGLLDTLMAPERWNRVAPSCSPKLKEHRGRVKRLGGYTSTPSGGVYHVRLPGGVNHTDLDPDAVASAFSCRSALITRGTHGHIAIVRVRYRDLLSNAAIAPHPEWTGHVVALGRDEDGHPLTIDLSISHAALGGASRSGKSNATHLVIAHYAANPKARLFLLDGKEGAELGGWNQRCDAFDAGEDDDPERPVRILGVVLAEIQRRNRANRDLDRRKSDEADHPPILVVVDEVASYSTRSKTFDVALSDIMRRGLATNVRVVVATQKATADAIPTVIRDLCETRVAFRCGSREMGVAILGGEFGAYAATLPSPVDDPARNAGRCYVVTGDKIVLGRAFHATPSWLTDAVSTTTAQRRSLTTSAAARPRAAAAAPAAARAREDDPAATVSPAEPTEAAPTNLAERRAGHGASPRRPRTRAEDRDARRAAHAAERAARRSVAPPGERSAEERGADT